MAGVIHFYGIHGGVLKGLSYEVDFENVDKIDRSWPLQGPRLVFEFFRGTSDFWLK